MRRAGRRRLVRAEEQEAEVIAGHLDIRPRFVVSDNLIERDFGVFTHGTRAS